MNFREYRKQLSPPWLQENRGAAWQDAFGTAQDHLIERARLAALVGYPEHAPVDALGLIGDERRIPRGPNESDESYRERLRMAFETWKWAGTRKGVRIAFNTAGYSVRIITAREFDPSVPKGWAWFIIAIFPPHKWEALRFDEGHQFDDNVCFGATWTKEDLEQLTRLTAAWKSAHAQGRVVLLFGNELHDVPPPEWDLHAIEHADGVAAFTGPI